jgi:hypothetical protein
VTEKRYLLGLAIIIALGVAASFATQWVADVTGTRWVMLPVAFLVVLAAQRLFEPFFASAIRAGHREPYRRSNFSIGIRLLCLAVFLGLLLIELWTGGSSSGPLFLGIVLAMAVSPMPRNSEVIADE